MADNDINHIYPSSSSLLPPIELAPSPMRLSTRRHRPHCPQQDCPIQSRPDGFSSLPWISLMDKTPEQLGLQDIVDLSQLPVDHESASSLGPVRRRKTFFRSSPLRPSTSSSSYHRDRSPSPSVLLPLRGPSIAPSSTPRPRNSRSRTLFHDLMPVFTRDIHHFRPTNLSPPSP